MANKKEKKQDQAEVQIKSFKTSTEWEKWLAENHTSANGIWLRFFKKASGIKAINYAEALYEALCYGWIDGQAKSYDEQSYLQRFTPRRSKSIWSKRNIEHIARLEKAGKMKPSGWKEVEAAKADGRWDNAYDPPSEMKIPDDFMEELSKNKQALAFFESLNKTNKYAVAWRLQTAKKPETREKRMKIILEMMAKGEKFHN
ncbi:MAG TPA: bacteriocin-protection protein, YdeI/OmpD-associated family [Prolixibacteraceae bacterium]|nr:bacteriocin-protection protein, YdeI/OmpD-associated family [Prolixibacteraceae bacterium]HCR90841.1 bacteriocin-protection protein, YdeI/OmpD-associated family [Prolixibacteraceae bacterium]HCU60079.1 bacteriocin-protection protein, YdeI/OmpD-associated family [Prolixibacteraceae bacterium]